MLLLLLTELTESCVKLPSKCAVWHQPAHCASPGLESSVAASLQHDILGKACSCTLSYLQLASQRQRVMFINGSGPRSEIVGPIENHIQHSCLTVFAAARFKAIAALMCPVDVSTVRCFAAVLVVGRMAWWIVPQLPANYRGLIVI